MDLGDLLKDPPSVHFNVASGVWWTERSCYEFIESVVGPNSRTLETGLGVSTALFATIGNPHICVVPFQDEVDKLVAYLGEHGIADSNATFVVAPSDEALPALEVEAVDLVLIDGGHGFPMPIIDWYYGARHLRRGGVLVIDDLQLAAVQVLDGFLVKDSRWTEIQRTAKWAAFRRESHGALDEGDWQQPFFEPASTREIAINLCRSAGADVGMFARKIRWRATHRQIRRHR